MELLESHAVRLLPPLDGPLLGLGDAFVSRFHSWHGASGRRYVTSVFTVDAACPDMNVPAFEACILIPVVRESRARWMLGVFVVEKASDRRHASASLRCVDEWHVHLLARDRRERAAVAADLRGRQDGAKVILSA